LTNPDKSEIFSLGLAFETNLVERFNALSEFSFKFPKSIDGGQNSLEAYDYLNNKRLIKIEGYGYFQIVNSEESADGSTPIKTVSCESLETELIQKKITGFGGTKKLWDILDSAGTILRHVIDLAPNWTVGTIDTSLLIKYRTFEISDSTLYNFLMNDIAKAFDCVFIFDTDLRTISAKAVSTSTTTSDIFLSFDNVIKSSTFSEKSDEIVTCLSVYGGGDLNIRAVNPLGTDKIYDFSYYKTTSWMSQALINAITAWENLVLSNQAGYSNLLTLLRGYNSELITLQSGLSTFQTALTVLETTKKVLIQTNGNLTSINSQMAIKQSQIDAQIILIANKQLQIDSTTQNLVNINNVVSFDANFTDPQLLELDNFIYQNTYKDENIIQTDIMTDVEIQDAEQDLYDKALIVLDKVSQPRYEIQIDSANYISLPEFITFTNQTELGTEITCEINPGVYIQTVLLEIDMTFDDPEKFSILLSNRVRKDGAGFTYSDLMGQVVKTGSSVSFDNLKWSNWENNHKDDVTTFITSALNTTTNNLINNSNQEILINQNGLRGRTYNPSTGQYAPTQVWLTSSVLAFSDDGFTTSKLALGSVNTSAGIKFGLVAEILVGNLIAGNTLTISNTRLDGQPTNFILNQTGATLYNAKFTISNNNSKILLDPNDSQGRIFRIQKNENTIWNDKFWVDNTGNVNFAGVLSGASGTFSGSLSAATGTFRGSLSAATGTFSGSLSAASGSFIGDISGASGTFSGNVYADRLYGLVSYSQLTDIPFNKITSGTAETGVVLQWPGNVKVSSTQSGFISIAAPQEIEISSNNGSSFILLDSGGINMYSDFGIVLNNVSWIHSDSGGNYPGAGLSNISVVAKTLGGANVILRFDNGILTTYDP
jgi:hypothetical protein